MASRGPKIKEEYIDTFLESISVTPNTKKIVTIDSEKLKVKIKQELAELAHRVAHRANGPGYEYQEPIYQEIERRKQNTTPSYPQSPISEKDFVNDDHFNLVFSKQEAAYSVLQARKASQPTTQPAEPAQSAEPAQPAQPPARSTSTNDLFRDRFINKIAQFQRAKSQTPTPATRFKEAGHQVSQISSTGTKNENVKPDTISTTQRFRSKLLRRTSSRSSGSSLSPVKKAGSECKDDLNIATHVSTQVKDRQIRFGTEQGGVNIKLAHSKSPVKGRQAAGSPRKPIDGYIANYELGNMWLRNDVKSDGNQSDKGSEDGEMYGKPTRPRKGESLWDYIAANC